MVFDQCAVCIFVQVRMEAKNILTLKKILGFFHVFAYKMAWFWQKWLLADPPGGCQSRWVVFFWKWVTGFSKVKSGWPPPPRGVGSAPSAKLPPRRRRRKFFLAFFSLFSHMFWSFFPKLLLADPPGGVWLLTYFLGRVTDLLFRELLLPPRGVLSTALAGTEREKYIRVRVWH